MPTCHVCKGTGTVPRMHIGRRGRVSYRQERCLTCRPTRATTKLWRATMQTMIDSMANEQKENP